MAETYKVVRRDYYGDTGKLVGAGLTKARAEEYAASMRAVEQAAFEVLPEKKG